MLGFSSIDTFCAENTIMELTLHNIEPYLRRRNIRHNPCLMKRGTKLYRNIAWGWYLLKLLLRRDLTVDEIISRRGLEERVKGIALRDMEIFTNNRSTVQFVFEQTPISYPYVSNAGVFGFAMMVNEVILSDQYHARQYLKPESVVIDAGANVGLFSVFAGKLAPRGKVYAFEVAEDGSAFVERNTRSMGNVVSVHMGLGDRETDTPIIKSLDGPGGRMKDASLPDYFMPSQTVEQTARITTIDRFVAQNKIRKVDFIKMDTEGYEKQIIRGAAETIKKFKPVISASTYHFASDKEEIPRLVLSIEPSYKYEYFNEAEEDIVLHI
jgi:FkbM family methyltransferase